MKLPEFDRRVSFDERSREHNVRELVTGKDLRGYTWRCASALNQREEGACVGFAFAHELAARPIEVDVTNEFARRYFARARQLDEWAGEDYSGTSVIAGAKVGIEKGYFTRYRWAFNLNDLMLAVGHNGPAVLGINWYEGMLKPDPMGWVKPTGDVVGGHAILCKGISLQGEGHFTLHNSWGSGWGRAGSCRISLDDLAYVLKQDGEACIPQGRLRPA